MDLRDRLKKFHEIEGVSYKNVAKELEISVGVMYNYTSGLRELKPHIKEHLSFYLEQKGY